MAPSYWTFIISMIKTQHNITMKTLIIRWKHTKGEPLFTQKGDV
jgi:hypothetical protein